MISDMNMEMFNPEKHDSRLVANLIYSVDPELNEMVYGSRAAGTAIISKMLQMDYNYFSYPHVTCAGRDGAVAGVLAGFEGKEKQRLEKASAKTFLRVFGFCSFLKRLPTLMRMANLTWKKIDEDGYLVNVLCVAPSHRGQGIGTCMMETVFAKYNKVYLEVNIKNDRAQKFYERLGFQVQSKNTIIYQGKEVGTYALMKE